MRVLTVQPVYEDHHHDARYCLVSWNWQRSPRTLDSLDRGLLPRDQPVYPGAAQRNHVDEDVARLAVAHHEAVALGPVEPFDLDRLEVSPAETEAA